MTETEKYSCEIKAEIEKLRKEAVEVENKAKADEAAQNIWQLYSALVRVGFSERMAEKIIIEGIKNTTLQERR